MTEPLLLAATRVSTFDGQRPLTAASGFFFTRDGAVFLVTSGHVLADPAAGHAPNRIEIAFHADVDDLTDVRVLSIWLFDGGLAAWRQGSDSGGDVDIAVVPLDRTLLPPSATWRSFEPHHLQLALADLTVGEPVLIVGFPLGFHDTVHHLPVVRQGAVASAFGVRFQGRGQFLTDVRTHRGLSGAPVVIRDPGGDPRMPWKLLGVHSSRMDMKTRDQSQDDALGLNCAWYASMLLALTGSGG